MPACLAGHKGSIPLQVAKFYVGQVQMAAGINQQNLRWALP